MNKSSHILAATILSQLATIPMIATASAGNTLITNSVVEGAIEVEAIYLNDYTDTSSSDLAVATVELSIDSTINKIVSSHILLLHEDGDTGLAVDEATIKLKVNEHLSLSIGQLYLPFGNFETNMISDSLAQQFSEAAETAVQIDSSFRSVSASFFLFNGDVLKTFAHDAIESIGFNITYSNDTITTGMSYTNNLSDSDLITDSLTLSPASTVVDYVSGISVYATTTFDKTSVFFEHITAVDNFDVSNLEFTTKGAKPGANNLEIGYKISDGAIAIAYQSTTEAIALGLPESRLLLSYSMEVMKGTSLTFEMAADQDYSATDGGSGDKTSTATVQLAVAF